MEILTFPLLDQYSYCLKHGFTTRWNKEDVPAPDEIRRELAGIMDISVSQFAVPIQVHNNSVKVATEGGVFNNTDALITRTKGIFLSVNVADCVPVFLFNPVELYCGIIHAGWRGTAEFITMKTIENILAKFGGKSGDILAVIGPAVGKCCYQVGSDVADKFSEKVKFRDESRWKLDLKQENKAQLLGSGLKERNIYVSDFCTVCHDEKFYSYRREGDRAGRMIGIIGLI